MKKKDFKNSQLKHELYQDKMRGKKYVVRKLHPNEVEYLSTIFLVAPYLYEIHLTFDLGFNPKSGNHPGIIKSLYYDYYRKAHKYTVFKTLSKSQVEACKRYGLDVKIFKYKIVLE